MTAENVAYGYPPWPNSPMAPRLDRWPMVLFHGAFRIKLIDSFLTLAIRIEFLLGFFAISVNMNDCFCLSFRISAEKRSKNGAEWK